MLLNNINWNHYSRVISQETKLKKWKLKAFDENGSLISEQIIFSSSKFDIKRRAKCFADITPGCDSCEAIPMSSDENNNNV